jgi:hypothetical protein
MVVDVAFNQWTVVARDRSQKEAEVERDERNEGLTRPRYTARMTFEPVAAGMGRACQ